MIDVHCHLNFHSFKDDYEAVIERARNAGVEKIINVGTKIDSSKWAIALAEKYENLYAIVGIHPHHADKLEENWLEELDQLARHPKVVAIGEIGLDYYRYQSNGIVDPALQKDVFIKQIALAAKHKLPLQIHNRQAGSDILALLEERKNLLLPHNPGMFHCFAGNSSLLERALALGFCIGFDGNSTYEGLAPGEDTKLADLAIQTPLDRLVTETDSPYLTPQPHRGSRNEPAYVIIVGQFLATLKEVPFEEFDQQTTDNAKRIFRLQ